MGLNIHQVKTEKANYIVWEMKGKLVPNYFMASQGVIIKPPLEEPQTIEDVLNITKGIITILVLDDDKPEALRQDYDKKVSSLEEAFSYLNDKLIKTKKA